MTIATGVVAWDSAMEQDSLPLLSKDERLVSMRTFILALGIGVMSLVGYCQQEASPPTTPSVPPKKAKPEETPKVTIEKPMSFWMAKKLEYSKSILESLTKGDFAKLATDAELMQRLGKVEGFVRRNKDYQTQLHSFEVANQELVRNALRRNVEGATLAFNQLTTSCVACHSMLREGIE
jgi:hypothetical protein